MVLPWLISISVRRNSKEEGYKSDAARVVHTKCIQGGQITNIWAHRNVPDAGYTRIASWDSLMKRLSHTSVDRSSALVKYMVGGAFLPLARSDGLNISERQKLSEYV